jgi:hypothetical protein
MGCCNKKQKKVFDSNDIKGIDDIKLTEEERKNKIQLAEMDEMLRRQL